MTPRRSSPLTTEEYQARQARAMSEEELTRAFLEACDLFGWTLRFHPYDSRRSEEGWPDWTLLNVRQRRCIFAELKGGRTPVTPKQAAWNAALRECGQEAYIWTPVEWLTGEIECILRGPDVAQIETIGALEAPTS